jgi:uncharacterized protein YkwD
MRETIVKLTLATAAAVALTACGGGDSGGGNGAPDGYTPHPFPAPPISESLKTEYLNAVNAVRAEGRYCGETWYDAAPPLAWDDRLYTAAYEHSQDMAKTGYFSHEGSGTESDWTAQAQGLEGGSNMGDRLHNNGVFMGGSENIASGTNSLSRVIYMWLNSEHHCSGIMDSYATILGMAAIQGYWTQEFSE